MGKPIGSWFRRTVPRGYQTATLTIRGTAPLLMNSAEADRDGELYRAFWMLGQKSRKSLDDEARLREMEWQLKLYLDEEIGPYMPGRVIKETLRRAATKWKKGEEIKRSLVVIQNRIPLIYDGPRDQQGLWDEGFRYSTMVANNGFNAGRVVRCRPMFPEWALNAEIAWDPEELDRDLLEHVVERSQRLGLLDYRPEFGAFEAELTEPSSVKKNGARGDAHKVTSAAQLKAHTASVERIMVTD